MDLKNLFDIEKSNFSQEDFKEICEEKVIIVYGAGNKGKDVFDVLNKIQIDINLFIDNNKFNTKFFDKDVISFYEFNNKFTKKENIVIIIAIFHYNVDIQEIINQLESIGIKYIYTFLQLFDFMPEHFGYNYWLSNKEMILKSYDLITRVLNLLNDDYSRNCLIENIKFRIDKDYSKISKPLGVINEYFPDEFEFWNSNKPINLLDCGAYDGDTIKAIIDKGFQMKSVIAFEPDLVNFSKLEKFISNENRLDKTEIILYPCGLWNEVNKISFSSNNLGASSIQANGPDSITIISLDRILYNYEISHIKMDIEGAEYNALLGSEGLIRKNKPNLAISLYHCPEDIWRIPLLIESWDLGYKFYIRTYEFSLFGTVLYCVK